ncbi:hypothetical protein [Nocardioides sp.]|uniref:hypothetical protein n=1 Tax=Nocardioides sp. TaxID=35761 RepID=UPI0039E457CB
MRGRPATALAVFGRAVLSSAVLWLVGGGIVQGIFLATHQSTLIVMSDGTRRGQAVWIGAQCLVAALAIAAATIATFSAVDFSDPRAGRMRTMAACGLLLALGLLGVWLAYVLLHLQRALGAGLAGAVVIGALAGLAVVWWRADPARLVGPAHAPPAVRRSGQSWGSR